MIELFYTTIVLFAFFFPFFLLCNKFKYVNVMIIFSQLTISFILLSKNFYKKHSLYQIPKFQSIQQLNFYPIKSLYKTYYGNGEFNDIYFDTIKTNKFSLIKSDKYSKQCLEHYFIQSNEVCPITEVVFEKTKSNKYQNCIQISDNKYIYYTNENKLGKLYKKFKYTEFEENKNYSYSLDEIVRKEYNKLSNPIIDFKYYIKFYDIICPTLIVMSLLYSFFEFYNKLNCNEFFNFSNIILQLIILIIYSIRFIKFIEIKKFLFDNEDIYKHESYFPNKVFNIDSFPIALSINIFIFYLLYIIFPNKIYCCEQDNYIGQFENNELISIIYLYLLPLFIGYFIVGIFDFLNDKKIKENYDRLISNWEMNPIISINLSSIQKDKYENYSLLNNYSIINNDTKYISFWEKYSIEYKRMDYYNYLEINKNKDNYNKKCGKDNYGNDLYFPKDVVCPINKIFFSDSYKNLINYTKIKLNNTFYLYYTNESVEGKIILDIKFSNSFNDFSRFPFNEEIDSYFDDQKFYAVNYIGINNSLISYKTSQSKIKNFEHNIKVYISLSIVKIIFFCIENLSIFITGRFIKVESYAIILFIFIKIAYIIILIISLNIHNIYINNFMNIINLDLAIEKNEIKWNVIILIYSLIFFFIYLFILFWIICDTNCKFRLKYDYKEKTKIIIKDNNKKEFDKDTIVNSSDSEKIEKRIDMNNKIKELNEEIEEKNENIRLLNEKFNNLKKNKNNEINEKKKGY